MRRSFGEVYFSWLVVISLQGVTVWTLGSTLTTVITISAVPGDRARVNVDVRELMILHSRGPEIPPEQLWHVNLDFHKNLRKRIIIQGRGLWLTVS